MIVFGYRLIEHLFWFNRRLFKGYLRSRRTFFSKGFFILGLDSRNWSGISSLLRKSRSGGCWSHVQFCDEGNNFRFLKKLTAGSKETRIETFGIFQLFHDNLHDHIVCGTFSPPWQALFMIKFMSSMSPYCVWFIHTCNTLSNHGIC